MIVSAYLYVCFGALRLYKATLSSGTGVHTLSIGTAGGKALTMGKFLLIGEAARVGAPRSHPQHAPSDEAMKRWLGIAAPSRCWVV